MNSVFVFIFIRPATIHDVDVLRFAFVALLLRLQQSTQYKKPSAFEAEMAIEKLKRNTSPGSDQIPTELIKARGRTIRSKNHKPINSIWN